MMAELKQCTTRLGQVLEELALMISAMTQFLEALLPLYCSSFR
jgi:hypothetical protein